jgi:archaemetzincin
LGHTYGLQHCSDPKCVMYFSNTLGETDRKRDKFCPQHQAELSRALEKRRQ